MKSFFHITIICVILSSIGNADILTTEVPWSGKIRNSTVSEILSRIQGWSEGQGVNPIKFSEKIPKDIQSKVIDRLDIQDEPRANYKEVILSVYKAAGKDVFLLEIDNVIKITYLNIKTFKIPSSVRERLMRSKQFNDKGVMDRMNKAGLVFSTHVRVIASKERSTIVIKGTKDDLQKASRFLGLK